MAEIAKLDVSIVPLLLLIILNGLSASGIVVISLYEASLLTQSAFIFVEAKGYFSNTFSAIDFNATVL